LEQEHNEEAKTLRKSLSSFFSSNFFCKKDRDVQSFLHNKAIRFEDADKSRTYFVVDEEKLNESKLAIFGYFSLGIKSIDLAEDVSKSQRRKLDGLSKNADSLNVYLIGQLAKNDSYKDKVTGTELLNYAIPLIKNCMRIIGGRVVLVECKNQEKLVDFYKKQNFTILQETEDSKNMIQLVRTLK
jgi:hypothetical protein